jgi:hypothetical protein
MTDLFLKNIERAYGSLEKMLNESRKAIENMRNSINGHSDYYKDRVFILCPSTPFVIKDGHTHRTPIALGNGYIVKIALGGGTVVSSEDGHHKEFYIIDWPLLERPSDKFQEKNVQILLNNGFVRENGFYVLPHKVVGVKIVDGEAHVDPDGNDWTIVEDVSENGKYNISDIYPYHFAQLKNRHDFIESYYRHVSKLMELYSNPNIDVDICRHGRPEKPLEPISRMLLLKEKDNLGEIIIGDLDNIEFIVKS